MQTLGSPPPSQILQKNLHCIQHYFPCQNNRQLGGTPLKHPFKGQQGPSGAAGIRHATNPAQFCGHNADVNSALNIKELYI